MDKVDVFAVMILSLKIHIKPWLRFKLWKG